MEGYHVGEKEYYNSCQVNLKLKSHDADLQDCGEGIFVLTNQRVFFSSAFGTWEENLDDLGVCGISKAPNEYGASCILCQIASSQACYYWVLTPAEEEVGPIYNTITKCIDTLES
jgi:hypothetical protein